MYIGLNVNYQLFLYSLIKFKFCPHFFGNTDIKFKFCPHFFGNTDIKFLPMGAELFHVDRQTCRR